MGMLAARRIPLLLTLLIAASALPLGAASAGDEGVPLTASKPAAKAALKKMKLALKDYRARIRDVSKAFNAELAQATGSVDPDGAEAFVVSLSPRVAELLAAWDAAGATIAASAEELYDDVDEGDFLQGFEGSGGSAARRAYVDMQGVLSTLQRSIERRLAKATKKAGKACWPVVPVVRLGAVRGDVSLGLPFTPGDDPEPLRAAIVGAGFFNVSGFVRNLAPGQVAILRGNDHVSFSELVVDLELDENGQFEWSGELANGTGRTYTLGVRDADGHETWLDQVELAPPTFESLGGSVACPALGEGEASGSGSVVLGSQEFGFEFSAGDADVPDGVVTALFTPPVVVTGSDPAATISFLVFDVSGGELAQGTFPLSGDPDKGAEVTWTEGATSFTSVFGSGEVDVSDVTHDYEAGVSSVTLTFDVVLGDGSGDERALTGALEACLAHFTAP